MSAEESKRSISFSRFILFFLPLLAVAISDLVTKHQIFAKYYPRDLRAEGNEPSWWIDGILGIQTSTNPGALFGLGSGYSWVFATVSIVILCLIIFWLFAMNGMRDRWLTFAFGLICGGIIGNLWDRLGWGYVAGRPEEIRYNVRDWILFRLEGVPWFDPWPNFNIADSALVIGAILLFLHAFLVPVEPASVRPGSEN